jgi:hypothetical protein
MTHAGMPGAGGVEPPPPPVQVVWACMKTAGTKSTLNKKLDLFTKKFLLNRKQKIKISERFAPLFNQSFINLRLLSKIICRA